MGKWSVLKGKLDPFENESSWQQKIDEAKAKYVGLDTTELARELMIRTNHKEALEAQIYEQNTELEALSQLIVSDLEGTGLQKITLDSGMSCSLEVTPYVSVVDTDEARAAYRKWISSKMIRPLLTLNSKTRDAFVKEELLKNFALGKPIAKPIAAWAKVWLKTRAKLYGKRKEVPEEVEV